LNSLFKKITPARTRSLFLKEDTEADFCWILKTHRRTMLNQVTNGVLLEVGWISTQADFNYLFLFEITLYPKESNSTPKTEKFHLSD
jgi:hypothetical protein